MLTPVDRMLELNKRRGGSRTAPTAAGGDTGATDLDREIASTDTEIDALVHELYGITEERQRIIES